MSSRRSPGRVPVVGGLCLAAVWSVPVIRIAQGRSELVLDLLPELLFGTASFVVLLVLWRGALEALAREQIRVEGLRREVEMQRQAVSAANERLVERSQELTDEVASIHARAERAEDSSRRKSEFLASMGQEVRQAVGDVLAGTDEVLATDPDDAVAASLQGIRHGTHALLDMIDDVLDFSAIESDRIELADESFELRELVEETLSVSSVREVDRGNELACMIDPELPRALRGDAARVRQVLVNFLHASSRLTENGTVRVRVDRGVDDAGENVVRFEVSDDGNGMSPERVANAFEESAATASGRSARDGLGLVICARLARLMGGDVGVSSREGAGNIFWFRLPLHVGEARRLHRVEKDVAGSRILVVSGGSATRLMAIQQLRECGCVPAASADGPSALAGLRAAATAGDPFRMVLTDVEVPGGSGLGFVEVVESESTFGRPKVLVMVSPSDTDAAARVDAVEGVRAIAKPMRRDELQKALIELLRESTDPRDEVAIDAVDRIAPAVEAAAERVGRESGRKEAPVRHGRVLVVDDNPVNRRVASLILKRAGYPVDVVEDGQIAVERILASDPYDLILMDVHMPRLNGFEATAKIRAMDDTRAQVPIVAMTASAMSGDAENCMQSGMDGYVSKPVKADALVAVVESWIPEDPGRYEASDDVRSDAAPDEATDEPATLEASGVEELKALAGDDDSMLQELLASFVETAANHLASMRAALVTGDRTRVAESSHGLRGSAGTIGAKRLHLLTTALEEDARADVELDEARIDAIATELEAVRRALGDAFGAPA